MECLWFRTSPGENSIYDDYSSADMVAAHMATQGLGLDLLDSVLQLYSSEDRPAGAGAWDELKRTLLFVQGIVGHLPGLMSIDMDLADYPAASTYAPLFAALPTLVDLSLCGSNSERLDPADVNYILAVVPQLVRLELDCVVAENAHSLTAAIAGLASLETLFLTDYLAPLTSVVWRCPLRVLALDQCDALSYVEFADLLDTFSATLTTLDLDNTPAPGDSEEEARRLRQPHNLPHLSSLVVSGYHQVAFLHAFASCPLDTLELGFNPAISSDDIEAFILSLPRLAHFTILSGTHLSEAQAESLELLCFAKNIDCTVEPPDSDDDDEDSEEQDSNEDSDEDEDEDDLDLDQDEMSDVSDEDEEDEDRDPEWEGARTWSRIDGANENEPAR